jgi:hypothetical protein
MRRIREPFAKRDWAKETTKTKNANILKACRHAVPAFYDMPQGTQKARWGGWLVFEAAARRAHRDCQNNGLGGKPAVRRGVLVAWSAAP